MAKISLKHVLLLSVLTLTCANPFFKGTGKFSVNLYKQLVAEHPQENVVINPLNCFASVILAYLGSEGQTYDKLTSVLNLGVEGKQLAAWIRKIIDNEDSESLFSKSSNIFLAEGIKTKPSFDQLADSFNVNLKHIKFSNNDAAITQINDWIKKNSSNALSNIVQPNYVIDSDTTALMLNAVSFKGKWKLHYLEMKSLEGEFWVHDDKKVKTSMISTTLNTKFKDFGKFTAITIPYKGTDLMMLVLLPKERDGLSDLEENLELKDVSKTLNGLNTSFSYVHVQLPKFKSSFTGDLRSPLSKMDLGTVFDESANFKNVGSKVKFNEFIHQMDFSIEEGKQELMLGERKNQNSFIADHPFLYFIIAPREYIYTMGRYIGPKSK